MTARSHLPVKRVPEQQILKCGLDYRRFSEPDRPLRPSPARRRPPRTSRTSPASPAGIPPSSRVVAPALRPSFPFKTPLSPPPRRSAAPSPPPTAPPTPNATHQRSFLRVRDARRRAHGRAPMVLGRVRSFSVEAAVLGPQLGRKQPKTGAGDSGECGAGGTKSGARSRCRHPRRTPPRATPGRSTCSACANALRRSCRRSSPVRSGMARNRPPR